MISEVKLQNPKPVMLKELEAAAFLGVSRNTLACWRCRGVGPRYAKFGRAVRYNQSDLVAYIEASTKMTADKAMA